MTPDKVNAIASCASATVSFLALIGLVFYVRYTKRMMESADSTYRGTIEPIVVADVGPRTADDFFASNYFKLALLNEGNGPALQTSYVQFNDQASITSFGTFQEFSKDLGRTALGTLRARLAPTEATEIKLTTPALTKSTMVVISYRDASNTWHQCQIKYTQVSQIEWQTEIVYCRKMSKFRMSRYTYPKRHLKD